MQGKEGANWSKVEQAAEATSSPHGKSKKASRKLLNKIHAWGVQAHGRQWGQPVGVHWHMVKAHPALYLVYGGVEAEVEAVLVPELQQQDGDRTLYEAARAKAKAKAVAKQPGQQTTMPRGGEILRVTQVMEEHVELLCRETSGVAAAATEEGATDALKQVVKDITKMVAVAENGQQLQ